MSFHFINKKIVNWYRYICDTGLLQAKIEEVPLWSSQIPGAILSKKYKEIEVSKNGELDIISKVFTPTLTIFIPKKPNGTAMVICPGGGYHKLAIILEGYKVAKWLNTLGITAFVLKYRLPSDKIMQDKTIGPLQDAQESIRFIRRNAEKWGVNTNKVGIIGFSAGGHLASTLATQYNNVVYKATDSINARPDFSVLIYPVISMDEKITHKGSKKKLLGKFPSDALIEKYSNEKQIDSLTPPTFIVHAMDDSSVPFENSIHYFLALKEKGVPSEIHLYQNGEHGFGLGRGKNTSKNWTNSCKEWLLFNDFIH